jgi:hypothetical protein
MTSPVKYVPRGEAKKTYAPATSIGIPGLCSGAVSTPRAFMASGGFPFVAGCRGVQLGEDRISFGASSAVVHRAYMIPGATALTLIPLGACC